MFKEREDYDTPQYKQWRWNIFRRDFYTCALCHRNGVPIQAHHIKKHSQYPHLRYVRDNGITLCIPCHELVTGREEAYEAEFKKIIAFKKIDRTKHKLNKKRKWRQKNIGLRY